MSEQSFAEVFELKDPTRTSFELDPKRDAALYIDRDGEVEKLKLRMRSEHRVAVIEGDFGTGKTHLLHYLASVIALDLKLDPIFVTLSDFKKTTGFELFHQRVIEELIEKTHEALCDWVAHPERYEGWSGESLNMNFRIALPRIGAKRSFLKELPTLDAQDPAKLAMAWLKGGMTPSQASRAGYLGTILSQGTDSIVRLYRALGELYNRHSGGLRRLLLIVDETEAFSRATTSDAQASLGSGMRGLLDNENTELGFVLGLYLPANSITSPSHPMMRADVRSRLLDGGLLKLNVMERSEERLKFLDAAWGKLTAKPKNRSFLLEPDATLFIATRMGELRKVLDPQLRGAVTPRDMLKLLSVIGAYAYKNFRPFDVITRAQIEAIFRMEHHDTARPGTLL